MRSANPLNIVHPFMRQSFRIHSDANVSLVGRSVLASGRGRRRVPVSGSGSKQTEADAVLIVGPRAPEEAREM